MIKAGLCIPMKSPSVRPFRPVKPSSSSANSSSLLYVKRFKNLAAESREYQNSRQQIISPATFFAEARFPYNRSLLGFRCPFRHTREQPSSSSHLAKGRAAQETAFPNRRTRATARAATHGPQKSPGPCPLGQEAWQAVGPHLDSVSGTDRRF